MLMSIFISIARFDFLQYFQQQMQESEVFRGAKPILMRGCILVIISLNLLITFGLFSATSVVDVSNQPYIKYFNEYVNKYEGEQKNFQLFSFYQNYDQLILSNHQINQQYRQGVDKLWNHTQKQFYQIYALSRLVATTKGFKQISKLEYDYYDWSSKVVKIKDMKFFEVSHIFAVLTVMEYHINREVKNKEEWVELSAQEIIDCCDNCLEKKPENVYTYIKNNGVTTQRYYPYENSIGDKDRRQCRRNQTHPYHKISRFRNIRNCTGLVTDLIHGPLVVGVDARNWIEYTYGIFKDCQRIKTHYGVLVGVNPDYWKVQNSLGTKWGQRGFIRLAPKDTCGICLHGSVPEFADM